MSIKQFWHKKVVYLFFYSGTQCPIFCTWKQALLPNWPCFGHQKWIPIFLDKYQVRLVDYPKCDLVVTLLLRLTSVENNFPLYFMRTHNAFYDDDYVSVSDQSNMPMLCLNKIISTAHGPKFAIFEKEDLTNYILMSVISPKCDILSAFYIILCWYFVISFSENFSMLKFSPSPAKNWKYF